MDVQDDSGRRLSIVDIIVRASIPALYLLLGWAGATVTEHESRLLVSEAQHRQHELNLNRITAEMRAIESAIPPDWFREKVNSIEATVKTNATKLADIDVRLARLEAR